MFLRQSTDVERALVGKLLYGGIEVLAKGIFQVAMPIFEAVPDLLVRLFHFGQLATGGAVSSAAISLFRPEKLMGYISPMMSVYQFIGGILWNSDPAE